MAYSDEELVNALRELADPDGLSDVNQQLTNSPEYPDPKTYSNRFGGAIVAAMRANVPVQQAGYRGTVPLTPSQFNELATRLDQMPDRNRVPLLVALLTGCSKREHQSVVQGINQADVGLVVDFSDESDRGRRTVALSPVQSAIVQRVGLSDAFAQRIQWAVDNTAYPARPNHVRLKTRKVLTELGLTNHRYWVKDSNGNPVISVTHSDLRCTHYLVERCSGASRRWLRRRLALSDDEITHYERFLDDPEDPDGWSVAL